MQSLRDLIEREGPDTIAAFIAEPVMGAGGVIIPPDGYYPAIQEVLDEHDIIMIDDEVINGFGRTGNWWGCQTLGMTPTTISVAKQLTAAYAPLGAVMVPEDIYQAYVDHSAADRHARPRLHLWRPSARLRARRQGDRDLPEAQHRRAMCASSRRLFAARLKRIGEHPLVGETVSVGLIGAAELVADKKTKRSVRSRRRASARNSPNSSKAMARSCARSATASRSARR